MSHNIPFVAKQFTSQLDRTVQEAKGEFDGFVERRTHELALAALAAGGSLGEVTPVEMPEVLPDVPKDEV
jgi:hypothetical protein